ncbi:MAG: hypothetical protein G01um101416_1247 [Microgenomates group bacterium Gr01-1014_16]|nr:MAG: hypothetical protein G01um101416_1247 [Microgenomates group bacterium Gr01-1014_16]
MGHETQENLDKRLAEARKRVEIGALYYHYKHPEQFYRVLGMHLLEETEEPCVVYQALYGQGLSWVRPVADFTAEVEADGKKVKRFEVIK